MVNHFKSKACGGASGADSDSGQGCFNATRVGQAQALLSFVSGLPAASGDEDILLIGDFNAYGEEDPIKTLEAAGFTSESKRFVPLASRYSFVFDGLKKIQRFIFDASLFSDARGNSLGRRHGGEGR